MKRLEWVLLTGTFFLCAASLAQTGQSLIANPLLSQNKVKEVKRQIVEAAHRETAPPSPPMPLPPQTVAPAGVNLPAGLPQGDGESARQALAKLRVASVVGDAALLMVDPLPAAANARASLPNMPMLGGFPAAGVVGQQQAMPVQSAETPVQRRGGALTVRHGRRTQIEGVDVIPLVAGDSVSLMLATMPKMLVFQGGVQPMLYSPSTAVAANLLEKPSSEYVNLNKPDFTSMSGGGNGLPPSAPQGNPAATQVQQQYPAVYPASLQR